VELSSTNLGQIDASSVEFVGDRRVSEPSH